MKEKITVIGSSNTDLVIHSPYFPNPGETIIGGSFNTHQGGKGANQAVAAARLGGDVTFISKLGDDDFGKKALEGFIKDDVNVKYIYKEPNCPSGVAVIIVNDDGENAIVVSPGANKQLKPNEIHDAEQVIKESAICLLQLEIPLITVEAAIGLAAKHRKKVILNPAPASLLSEEAYSETYLITPNETEAMFLTGIEVTDEISSLKAAEILLKKGVSNVIITLGEKGAFFKNNEMHFIVPAPLVQAVDTTAAGDTFNGALAVALAEGKDWRQAILFANEASAMSVKKLGAQSSIPYRSELLSRK